MKQPIFLSFILMMTVGWMRFYAGVRETYNGISDYKTEIGRLHEESARLKVARDLDHEHFLEFRQYVATLMPDVLKQKGEGEGGYPYRRLASVVTSQQADQIKGVIAKTLFERGKDYFKQKQYEKAEHVFKQVIDRFSYTPYVTESYFLLAESHFQSNELENCVEVIQRMVELFPQSELTGFALIRLGSIYQIQNRNEEAVDIYKTVMRSYPQRDVASQARASLRDLEL
jgi:TolA-binding protein